MKTEKEIKNSIDENKKDLKEMEKQGQDRDWSAYNEIEGENEVLEWVLN